tara:strand:+ start:1401 stop:1937 length:537 start_codon:yes stop_codon:yes gene_type:complete
LTGRAAQRDSIVMRLADHLAARRCLYARPLATMPDVLLIDIPPVFASPSLPLGRYYPVIIETDAEYAEMEAFLDRDRPELIVPDLLDRRPSALHGGDIVIARYAPSAPGWPWLLICRWPADYAAMVPGRGDYFARRTYTSEVFETVDDLADAEGRLLGDLGSHRPVRLAALPEIMGHA